MKTKSLIFACVAVAAFALTASALTTEDEITSDYVREHPDDFSVSAAKGKDSLIDFTITHNVATPSYHVAHLAIHHDGKVIATSDTPSFGKKRDNTFHFSISADDIAESEFSLSDGALDSSGEVPVPGTAIHQFRLSDFVPKVSLTAAEESLPDHCAILPVSEGPTLIKQCSRRSPNDVSGFWSPSPAQVIAIEKLLPELLRKSGHKLQVLGTYRQYVGITVHGKKLIYVNSIPTSAPSESHLDWRTKAIMVCDGGDAFWGVEVDSADNTFQDLEFNGVA